MLIWFLHIMSNVAEKSPRTIDPKILGIESPPVEVFSKTKVAETGSDEPHVDFLDAGASYITKEMARRSVLFHGDIKNTLEHDEPPLAKQTDEPDVIYFG